MFQPLAPTVALACAGLALSSVGAAPTAQESIPRETLRVGTFSRIVFERDIRKVAIADEAVLGFELLGSRELLLHARSRGRTNALFWFDDESTQSMEFAVAPDLSVLELALQDLHPDIRVEPALDRNAVVLRGVVTSAEEVQAAELLALAYLGAEDGAAPLVGASQDLTAGSPPGDTGQDPEAAPTTEPGPGVRPDQEASRGSAAVINLLRTSTLPARLEEKMATALVPLAGEDVWIERVVRGATPLDDEDLFVLYGSVADQVTLARVLHVAAGVLGADRNQRIEVLADEGGALRGVRGQGSGGGNNNQGNGQSLLGGAGSGGFGQNQAAARLQNNIQTNLGRARVVSAAGGRLLSMIEVEDLPLVQVDVRFYEVNVDQLREVGNDLRVLFGDFDQSSLEPAVIAPGVQGVGAPRVGQDDLQGALGFLNGGLSSQLQLVTGGLAVDTLFQLLETRGLARSVSEPSLTVLSGETARFEVGGQVPVPVALTVGGGTDQILNGVEFRDFGVRLAVRPSVGPTDVITMDLSPAVSAPDLQLTAAVRDSIGSNLATTAFESRAILTSARLNDGQALLVSGLTSRSEDRATSEVPFFGQIPLIGSLFRNQDDQSTEFELIVVVRPTVVREPRHDSRIWLLPGPERLVERVRQRLRSTETATTESGEAPRESETAGA